NDEGPNTGGMGAYSPLDWLPEGFTEEVMERVAYPTLREMEQRGTPFTGVLYCGLAITKRGIRVIEFNARFGDPETQAVLARLKTPLGGVLLAAAQGKLDDTEQLVWSKQTAVDVVIAAENYPDTPVKGAAIAGLEAANGLKNVHVMHAGTAGDEQGNITVAGGRVLAVVGLGDDLSAARAAAYAGVAEISWPGAQSRSDIALKAERGEIVVANESK
ncbi:phosphoribosylamine--glycine ligase, partial [Glutamicibacter protophormiae]|uniref:phosphoribosylamine--glycine ligase n=1 Tax=Glutamicibacter protophormiae TaxID=37930 RepID=UPI003BB0D056